MKDIFKVYPIIYVVIFLLFTKSIYLITLFSIAIVVTIIYRESFKPYILTLYRLKFFIAITALLLISNRGVKIEVAIELMKIISIIGIGFLALNSIDITKLFYQIFRLIYYLKIYWLRVVLFKIFYTLFFTFSFAEILLNIGKYGRKIRRFRNPPPKSIKDKIEYYSNFVISIFRSGLRKGEYVESLIDRRGISPDKLDLSKSSVEYSKLELLCITILSVIPPFIFFNV